jgi:NADH-quinone oxidoreductase subunit I
MSKYIKFWERFYIMDMMNKNQRFGSYKVDKDKCIGCGMCVRVCPGDCLMLDENKNPVSNIEIEKLTEGRQLCGSCGACMACCPEGAITVTSSFHLDGKFKLLRRGPIAMPRLNW